VKRITSHDKADVLDIDTAIQDRLKARSSLGDAYSRIKGSGMRSPVRTALLAMLAMIAFAANSILCRMALKSTAIDAGSFTSIRIVSGAVVLGLIVRARGIPNGLRGSWLSALTLFVYAAGFSYAYVKLPTAVGALILFGAVQTTMIGYGLWIGERMSGVQVAGLCAAFAGLVSLLLPGLWAPPPVSSALMLAAGVAWGIYSLRGKGSGNPTVATAGNFLRAVPFTAVLCVTMFADASLDRTGAWYAVVSGGLASGVGYAIWYAALPGLKATNAATIQLCVPVIAAAGGVIFLGEAITLRLLLSSAGILGGISLVIISKKQK
jgi:drug/metabolite transporter (DMT)-like permease